MPSDYRIYDFELIYCVGSTAPGSHKELASRLNLSIFLLF